MKVLLVSDDQRIRDALRCALMLAGHDIDVAEGGEQTLTQVVAVEPDAVLVDAEMEGLDGLALCRRLRSAGNRVPVLMLTAQDRIEDRIAGLDAGADDYLVKPFNLRELEARLHALVRRTAWRASAA